MAFLLLAHRGACREAPENTLAAFEQALTAGCDGCECDVQLSRDGTLVVFHDETLERLAAVPRTIPTLTAQELGETLLAGAGSHPPAQITVPTLEAVCRLHLQRQKTLFAELKYFSEAHTPRERLGAAVLQFVQQHQPGDRFHAISFDEPLLEWLKTRLPSLRTGYIFSDLSRFAQHREQCLRWADCVLPHVGCATDALARWAHDRQRPCYAWVADDDATMTRLAGLGMDGLLTNEPARLVSWAKSQVTGGR